MLGRVILRRLRNVFASLIGSIIIVGLILTVCLLYFGQMLAIGDWRPLDGALARTVVAVVLWLVLLLAICLILWSRSRRDRRMAEDIVGDADADADPSGGAVKAELAEVREKMRTAMGKLRKSKLGRKHLYELPWYVMIGPPGAGKTTAIVNSGLQFPLAEEFGRNAIGGVGGTRNCDWWFTNSAVLIDTAGRFTTQESDAAADSGSWLGFLAMLKRHRKRQPINGAMVAISLSDLSLQDEITQANNAKAVRRRLNELREKLGVRFPVYIIFTKSDLIAGFSEFFEGLGKEAREQVWGFTLPMLKGKGEASPLSGFDEEFSQLLTRLNAQSLERMQQETDHQRRSLIAGFPAQVASVRQVARDFLNEVFQDNRFEARHMLRGVYFTSGTQEGTPIDRLMMGMARTFGIGRQAIGSGKGTGRSFFLTRLFDGVIFREAGLVSADDKVERRYRWTKRAAFAAVAIVAVGAGTFWTRSFLGNREIAAETEAGFAKYTAESVKIPGSPIADTDFAAVVPALNLLRALPANSAVADYEPPVSLGWGLSQGDVIGDGAGQAYHAALVQHLQPRLMLSMEQYLQQLNSTAETQESGLLYDALKVYLNLGGIGPQNKDLIRDWMTADWERRYPDLRDDLMAHLDALLAEPPVALPLNGDLVATVRASLINMPMAKRVYNGIINSPEARALPKWRVSDAAGPAADRVLVRSSGVPLSDGIPGIYTYAGFNDVFKAELGDVARRVQADSWALGDEVAQEPTDADMVRLGRDVLKLYSTDFITEYEKVLGDVDIVPIAALSEAVEVTNVLSSPSSPIVNLLNSIAAETRLTEDRTLVDTAIKEGTANIIGFEASSRMGGEMKSLLEAISESDVVTGGNGEKPLPPGTEVERRFAWLQDLVAVPEGSVSPLDKLIGLLNGVYNDLNKMSFTGTTDMPEDSAILKFQMEAASMKGPIERWATQIASGSSGITAEGTRSSIDARWKSQVLPFCEQALSNRYPFDRLAPADMALTDFAKLFGPSGLIDTFYNENLAKYVDASKRPWELKPANGTDIGVSSASLLQMQYADEIKQAFFPSGPAPSVTFQIKPYSVDAKARSATLEIDGTTVPFDMDAPTPVQVVWPGSVGFARLTLLPDKRGSENTMQADGPWAWFRLLDAASPRTTSAEDRLRIFFTVGQRVVIADLQSSAVVNPFYLAALRKFSCPKSF